MTVAVGAWAQGGGTSISIGLVDPPASDGDRGESYIVEHVAPGQAFSRAVAVANPGTEGVSARIYVAPAEVRDGTFTIRDGIETQLTSWVSLDVSEAQLAPGESRTVRVSVQVPSDAASDEYLGAVFAEVVDDSTGNVVRSRVGVRIYLSVGPGGAPRSNFSITTMTTLRLDDGTPAVDVGVVNSGGRAVDIVGALALTEGPGGLQVPPTSLASQLTLDVGQSGSARFVFDAGLPTGPWLARADLRSGLLERVATATITFPDVAGEVADPVPAEIEAQRRLLIPISIALIAALLVGLYVAWRAQKVPLQAPPSP